jgi:hypothetical protein
VAPGRLGAVRDVWRREIREGPATAAPHTSGGRSASAAMTTTGLTTLSAHSKTARRVAILLGSTLRLLIGH